MDNKIKSGRFKDYTGKKIGRLTFLSYFKKENRINWNIECDCGNIFTKKSDYITTLKWKGSKFECIKCKMRRRLPIELNSKFGRLTVIKEIPGHDHHRWFLCLCECGKYTEVPGVRLAHKSKPTRSCGCYARKLHSKWANTTQYPPAHGYRKNKNIKKIKANIYNIRNSFISACYNKGNYRYKNYGQKGCSVCDLWRNGAKEFYNWAIINGFKKGCAIILKPNNSEFNPSNCIVIKKSDYFKDKNSKFISFNDKVQSISKWSKELGCTVSCLSQRLKKFKPQYGLEKAMDLSWNPPRKQFYGTEHFEDDIVKLYNQGKTYFEITKQLGCSSGPIKRFLTKNGISPRSAKRRTSLFGG